MNLKEVRAYARRGLEKAKTIAYKLSKEELDPSEEYWAEMTSRRYADMKSLHPHEEDWNDKNNNTKDDLHR